MVITLILSAIAVGLTAWLLPGVTIEPWWWTIIVAIVLGLLNAVVKPIIKLFALPITILTLGLFTLVINALIVLLCAWLVPAFKVDGFVSAFLFAIILWVVTWILNLIFNKK
jgi:putative membrane protein